MDPSSRRGLLRRSVAAGLLCFVVPRIGFPQLINTPTPTRTPTPVNIGNFVWDDLDGDGRQDAGEPGLAGVTVQLWNSGKSNLIDSAVTNGSGIYAVTAPAPGNYRIRVLLPGGLDAFSPKDQAGGDDLLDSDINPSGTDFGFTDTFNIASNVISTVSHDAGILKFRTPTPTRTPTPIHVGNFVWNDADGDGVQDAGEAGLANVSVQLWNGAKNDLIGSTTTNASGIYTLIAPAPGNYRVRVLLPNGASFTAKDVGADTADSDFNPDGVNAGFTDIYVFASNLISIVSIDAGLTNVPATPTSTATRTSTPTPTRTRTPTPSSVFVPQALDVDPVSGAGHDGNGMLEPGETATVRPSWNNNTGSSFSLSGAASAHSGPGGASYTIPDASAGYGVVGAGANGACASTANCYALFVSDPATRPAAHWDSMFSESLTHPGTPDKVWTLHVGDSFTDVPRAHLFYRKIETIFHNLITTGCTPTEFCPTDKVPRSQMAIFMARGIAGGGANVPPSGVLSGSPYNCVGGGISLFSDVLPTDIFCKSVHYIAVQNVTTGCAPSQYCPSANVTRGEMAIFTAKAVVAPLGGGGVPLSYGPDSVTGLSYSCNAGSPNLHFKDILTSDAFCKHVHFLWATGIIGGCSADQYCAGGLVGRDEMSKFLSNAFGLLLYGP